MKIKTAKKSYEKVIALKKQKHKSPVKSWFILRLIVRIAAMFDLIPTKFTYKKINMERLRRNEPCLILMNHSSFIDLKIASKILFPRPYHIICTSDGFVGKNFIMRHLGCIPTRKFVSEAVLLKDMHYALKTLKSSVLMYPEASYSFDGTATTLPESLGKCLKLLGVPLVVIRAYGAFARDPLYNNLQTRKVKVSADIEYLLSPEEIKEKSVDELNQIIKQQFSFDYFAWQKENKIKITEPFRADYLERTLYKCPVCGSESGMKGKGIELTCNDCKQSWQMDEYGSLYSDGKEVGFSHIPNWYAWQRECVKNEILEGKYILDTEVDVYMMVNTKCIYNVGKGRLVHNADGFSLKGNGFDLDYKQSPLASHSLYSDFYWYEIGDVICIGDRNALYYCFPKGNKNLVAKTRLAAEELYKIAKAKKRNK